MRADLKNGKTVITLHEADKRAMNKARDILRFVHRNSDDGVLRLASDCGSDAIGQLLGLLCAETPEDDDVSEDVTVVAGAA